MRAERIIAGALALALSACVSSGGVHPAGRPTAVADLHAERSLAEIAVSPAAWPSEDWWRALGDAQLDALIDEALRDNPDLAAADAVARAAQAQSNALDAARGPQVDVTAEASGARLSEHEAGLVLPEATGTFGWLKTASVDFSWGLDLWGGKRAAWEAALGLSRAAEIDRRAARIALSTNVARAYVHLRETLALRDIGAADLERARRIRDLTRSYIDGGLGTPDSRHQVDTEAGVAEQRLAQADLDVDGARIALSILLGKGPDRGLDIGAPAPLQPLALAVPPELPADLLGGRPDLVAARWRVEAAGRDIDAAKTRFLPNVSLTAMAGFLALGDSVDLFQLPSRTYAVTPAISLPIFDGGRLRAQLDATDAGYDAAVAHYNQRLVHAVNEVADLLAMKRSLLAQQAIQQAVVANARAAWHDATLRFQAGLGTELDTLTVRQQLSSAERTLAALEARQADTSVRLVEALGGGFRAGDAPSVDSALADRHTR